MALYDRLQLPPDRQPTSITREEAGFLLDFLGQRPLTRTIETGFAFGFSAAHILSATTAPHIAIDPYAHNYQEIGLANLTRLGLAARLELIREPSQLALPRLVERGVTVDFAFIDGGHLFEEIFIDWYFIDLLLTVGGHVMFHDRWLKATQLIASFISNNRADYRMVPVDLPNLYLFEKIGGPERAWQTMADFYSESDARAVQDRCG